MEYSGGIVYETGASGNRSFQLAGTPEGRVIKETSGDYKYQYYLSDHLGNIRVVFEDEGDDGDPDIVQSRHYYPFGLTMGLQGVTAGQDNRYLYQGKELQPDAFMINGSNHHLEWYDFSARFYDPQIGRWHVADPACQFASPYLAMGNNPVSISDPDGCWADGGRYTYMNQVYAPMRAMNEWHAWLQSEMDADYGRGNAGFYAMFSGRGGGGGNGGHGGGHYNSNGSPNVQFTFYRDGEGKLLAYGIDSEVIITNNGFENGLGYDQVTGKAGYWVRSYNVTGITEFSEFPLSGNTIGEVEIIDTWTTFESQNYNQINDGITLQDASIAVGAFLVANGLKVNLVINQCK